MVCLKFSKSCLNVLITQQFKHHFFFLLSFSALSSSLSRDFPLILLLYLNHAEFVIGSALKITVGGLLLTGGLKGELLGSSL